METAFVFRHTRMLHLYIHPSVQIMSATLRKRKISQYVWTMLGPPASLLRKYRAAGKGQWRNYVVLPGWTPSRLPLSAPTSKMLPTQPPKKRKTVAHHKVRKKCCMERTAPYPLSPCFYATESWQVFFWDRRGLIQSHFLSRSLCNSEY